MKIVNSIGQVIVDLNSESVKNDVLSLRYDTYDHEFVKLANDVIQAIDKVKEYHKVKQIAKQAYYTSQDYTSQPIHYTSQPTLTWNSEDAKVAMLAHEENPKYHR